jgi:hypothetical protein
VYPTSSALISLLLASIVVPVVKIPAIGKKVTPSKIYSTPAPLSSKIFTVKEPVS